MASSLDDFMADVCTQDTRKRVQAHGDLVTYLSLPRSSLACEDVDKFIDGLIGWVTCSNYKISLNGLEVLCLMVDRMGEDFKVHVSTVLPAVIDRLGDAKDPVRDQAQQLLLKLMLPASSPQYVFERMMGAFAHKLWHVREGVLICLQNTLNTYGARSLQLSKVVPSICKLLDDQNSQVREAAVNTLAEIYRHVGEKVRVDLARKGIAPQRLNQIYAKFDELKASGNMLPTADLAPSRGGSVGEDEADFARPLSTKVPQTKRVPGSSASSTTSGPVSTLGPPKRVGQSKSAGATSQLAYKRRRSASATSMAAAGGVDEELFIKSFEDVPKVQMYSGKDLQDLMTKINTTLLDSNPDNWEKRVDAMKQMRSLLLMGAADYDEFLPTLRSLEPALLNQVKDLRSQIVREACVTIAYYAQQMGHRFDRMAEVMLPRLIELIPNSAKVMATSGLVALRFIIQYCHTARLVPLLVGFSTAKSNIVRRFTYEFLNQMLHTWPTHMLEKHIAILQDAIKKGISDADSEARAFSRKAFWGFADHFREQADALLGSLDPSKQKLLQGEMSNSSSSNSINSAEAGRPGHKGRTRSSSQDRHDGSTLTRSLTGPRRTGPSRISSSRSDAGGDVYVGTTGSRYHASHITRSSSAADLSAGVPGSRGAPPSKPRSSASALLASRLAVGSTHSLPRQKSSVSSRVNSGLTPSQSERQARSRSRIGVSQSQPSSRSGSPSSRLTYLTHQPTSGARADPTTPSRSRRSVIPRSQGASREASPNRVSSYSRERRLSGSKIGSGGKGKQTGILSQRLLRPGTDVEDALHDALALKARKRYESYDSDDAASETSSICSERSFSSYSGRTSEDMQEIIAKLGSGAYSERKDGLVSLYLQLKANRFLNRVELKKVTEIFTRMFHDPHSKVFSGFLDTLMELVGLHARDLQDWLYTLLTRLLTKTGTDMLGSVQAKCQRALDCVRENFPCDHQFNALTKFIVDQSQSPNLKQKVKLSLLHYLHALIVSMDPTDFGNSMDTRLALSRIITWTNEPKNAEIRKAAQMVLIALFNLNAPEFSLMLSALPKAFQDGATKILHNHIRSASSDSTGDVLSPRNVTSPPGQKRSRPPSRSSLGHPDDVETENLNPEDVHNSIWKVSEAIASLSINSKLDYDDPRKKRDFNSQDSGIQDLRNDSPDAPGPNANGKRSQYNPLQYTDESTLNGLNKSALAEPYLGVDTDMFNEGLGGDQGEVITEILSELSNHNERVAERKNAMLSLIKMTREEAFQEWDEHFKSILLILLETLGDNDGQIRALALRVLREILLKQPERFQQYAELTTLRVLEAHQDQTKEVVRSAEECATTLANSIPPEQCMRILNPIVQTAKYPVNLAAIKMQNKVIERLPKECVERTLEDCIPGLLKGYDDQESSVRKASVFCLVSIYLAIGESLRPYIKDLNGSKMKLLNLYIKRSQGQKDGGGSGRGFSSPASSDT